MDSITLENFRCFRERQTARLAPLTLLVGENSTGKTSFLALIRALWDVAYERRIPDFKEYPFDLGSFDEIAHHRNYNGRPADQFSAGFEIASRRPVRNRSSLPHYFEATFERSGTIPVPIRRWVSRGMTSIEETYEDRRISIVCKTEGGSWQHNFERSPRSIGLGLSMEDPVFLSYNYLRNLVMSKDNVRMFDLQPIFNSSDFSEKDLKRLQELIKRLPFLSVMPGRKQKPFAIAPIRSKPQRTYDPSRPMRDPEGDYVPMYLAYLDMQDQEAWKKLQSKLESFGRDAGLFDQISINQLGRSVGSPFQIQIRKFSQKRKGPQRNLVDVGYGISQILPLITELLREDAPDIFLFQQPEIHLHPSARAALGSLFCHVAGNNKQLIIETHNDYILDRVRMDIRDQSSPLKPEDVSILFFERRDLDVRIHSLRYDGLGNVLDIRRVIVVSSWKKSVGPLVSDVCHH